MQCPWCHQESKTNDVCEWCKRPMKSGGTAPTPGAKHLRARELAQVRLNDRLLIYSMLGLAVLVAAVMGYTYVVQPPEVDELPPAAQFLRRKKARPATDPAAVQPAENVTAESKGAKAGDALAPSTPDVKAQAAPQGTAPAPLQPNQTGISAPAPSTEASIPAARG